MGSEQIDEMIFKVHLTAATGYAETHRQVDQTADGYARFYGRERSTAWTIIDRKRWVGEARTGEPTELETLTVEAFFT